MGGILAAMALLALTPGAVVAPTAAATSQHDARKAERALVLARALNSEKIIIGDAESDEKLLGLMKDLTAGNAELRELEHRYPGIMREIAVKMLPIINRSARERLPQLWQRQAALYAKTFDADELDTLIRFYTSPTGLRMIDALSRHVTPERTIAEASKSEDFAIRGSTAIADIRASVPKVVGEMTPEDQSVLRTLMASGLLPRMQRISVETQNIAIAWHGETAPWEDAETEKAFQAVVEARLGAKK